MARVVVTAELVAEMVFGYAKHPVIVKDARFRDAIGAIEFEIEGPDVPDVREVKAHCSLQQNRRGERLTTMEFKAVE